MTDGIEVKRRKERLFRVIRTAVFLAGLLAIVIGLNKLCMRKEGTVRREDFFSQKEDFDVLFLGNSHTMDGVFPMELWNEQGIVSYNLGVQGCRIPTTYWILRNALEHTTPKLVVVDIASWYSELKIDFNSGYVFRALDSFPLNLTKMRAVRDLYTETDETGTHFNTEGIELLFPLLKYHSRWAELTKEDFQLSENHNKGAVENVDVAEPAKRRLLSVDDKLETETVGKKYLKKIIKECEKRGIEVLLTYLPFPAYGKKQRAGNGIFDFAEEKGVNYLNFHYIDGVVDFNTDLADSDSHLNPSGAKKVTSYLGEYIKEKYDIPDRREDAAYAGWKEDYERYVRYKVWLANHQETLPEYLMLWADDRFCTQIYRKEASEAAEDELITRLIENIENRTVDTEPIFTEETGDEEFLRKAEVQVVVTDAVTQKEVSRTGWTYSQRGENAYEKAKKES